MGKIIVDNLAYAKVVKHMGEFRVRLWYTADDPGFRTNASSTSFESLLPEDLEATIKAAAELSMGTEISESDMLHINSLCDQVISITEYRTQLSEYLRNRMQAIAPNLTALVGDLVGARLISHAGSLMNLAKHPASTVQILGAEKALFRALKTKHDTPKYGLIYHVGSISLHPLVELIKIGISRWSSATEAEGKDGSDDSHQSIPFYTCRRLVRRRIESRPPSRRDWYHEPSQA